VFLEQFGENSIDFKLVVWSSEMSDRPSRYRSDLNFAIAEKLHEAGIEFPFPQRDVHIKDGVLKVENVATRENTDRSEATLQGALRGGRQPTRPADFHAARRYNPVC